MPQGAPVRPGQAGGSLGPSRRFLGFATRAATAAALGTVGGCANDDGGGAAARVRPGVAARRAGRQDARERGTGRRCEGRELPSGPRPLGRDQGGPGACDRGVPHRTDPAVRLRTTQAGCVVAELGSVRIHSPGSTFTRSANAPTPRRPEGKPESWASLPEGVAGGRTPTRRRVAPEGGCTSSSTRWNCSVVVREVGYLREVGRLLWERSSGSPCGPDRDARDVERDQADGDGPVAARWLRSRVPPCGCAAGPVDGWEASVVERGGDGFSELVQDVP